MENSKIMNAPDVVDLWNALEEEDEADGVYLSDEDILRAFLMDGCDIDGTPLVLMPQPASSPAVAPKPYTLH